MLLFMHCPLPKRMSCPQSLTSHSTFSRKLSWTAHPTCGLSSLSYNYPLCLSRALSAAHLVTDRMLCLSEPYIPPGQNLSLHLFTPHHEGHQMPGQSPRCESKNIY